MRVGEALVIEICLGVWEEEWAVIRFWRGWKKEFYYCVETMCTYVSPALGTYRIIPLRYAFAGGLPQ